VSSKNTKSNDAGTQQSKQDDKAGNEEDEDNLVVPQVVAVKVKTVKVLPHPDWATLKLRNITNETNGVKYEGIIISVANASPENFKTFAHMGILAILQYISTWNATEALIKAVRNIVFSSKLRSTARIIADADEEGASTVLRLELGFKHFRDLRDARGIDAIQCWAVGIELVSNWKTYVDSMDDPESEAKHANAMYLADRESSGLGPGEKGVGVTEASLGKHVLACKFAGVTGDDRFGEAGSLAFREFDSALDYNQPFYELNVGFGGPGFLLVLPSVCLSKIKSGTQWHRITFVQQVLKECPDVRRYLDLLGEEVLPAVIEKDVRRLSRLSLFNPAVQEQFTPFMDLFTPMAG
jgi:hypothetical protein